MSVYRELAAELRANKAVIDSLKGKNQHLLQQNQFLKQEIHNVVQAALNLGQIAGVARQNEPDGSFPGFPQGFPQGLAQSLQAVTAPESSTKLTQTDTRNAQKTAYERQNEQRQNERQSQQPTQPQVAATQSIANALPRIPQSPSAAPATPRNRVPRPITPNAVQKTSHLAANPAKRPAAHKSAGKSMSKLAGRLPDKLFTEQSGQYRSSILESQGNKEIGGIWLALSIILIIVTAFGAGFLIMKPLLNDR